MTDEKPAPPGLYTNGDSIQNALRLLMGIVPADLRDRVMEKLENTIVDETLTLTVTVPPGTTATVVVPGDGPVRTKAQRSVSRGAGARSFEVAPGTHVFQTARPVGR